MRDRPSAVNTRHLGPLKSLTAKYYTIELRLICATERIAYEAENN
jgi:hypothetical protein